MTPPGPGASILVVEDSLTQALKLRRVLEQHGHHTQAAGNGREALAAVEKEVPTLIITDINMPEMDGYELCHRLKQHARSRHIPVILLTSLSDPQDILKGLECGADNFIVKPYDEEFLLNRIDSVLANLELRSHPAIDGSTEIFFAGHKYRLTADRVHSIDLLLSTYETAVHKNIELSKAKERLEIQAAELRQRNAQMNEELAMARELQTAFVPRNFPVFPRGVPPEQSAIRFSYRYSTTTQLGGDFLDVLALSDTEGGVFICDVMGHGVRAALVTAILRGLVEELKPAGHDPARFLTELNRSLYAILHQTATPVFATALYLVIDVERSELRYANAGHPAPFHLRRGEGTVTLLADMKPGPALGVFDNTAYESAQCGFSAHDMVMLYTDGLYEVEGADGSFFTKEQLLAEVTKRLALPAAKLFDELVAEIKGFAVGSDFEDDMYVVGVEVEPLPPRPASGPENARQG